jgi:methyl-accepting chemotaxis protein
LVFLTLDRAYKLKKPVLLPHADMRSLAARASDSVGEIRALIQKNIDQVKAGSHLVNETGESISAVLDKVFSLGALVGEIATEIESQSRGLAEINNGMSLIEAATQENASLASKARDAGGEMKSGAMHLRDTVAGFSVGSETGAAGWQSQEPSLRVAS